jgi:NAD(P)-dependent dehydrogenase (short-subunit alcohol dehydrogenase family)
MRTGEKIIVVTGANAGIGFATACGLARQGASLVLVCRDPSRGKAALAAVGNVAVSPPRLFIADFALQSSVRELSRKLHEQLPRIDVLINNAGAAFARRELTADGIEKTFAINHLAPFLLTNLVLDLIRQSSAGRIVNVTAGIPVSRSSFLENLEGEKHYSQFNAYRSSKVGNILFTYELASRLQGTGITVNCVHPGPVRTEFTRKAGGTLSLLSKIFRPIMRSPEVGARTVIYLAVDPEVAAVTGGYFVNCRQKKSASITYDRTVAEEHWRISEELTRLKDDRRNMPPADGVAAIVDTLTS